MGLRAHPGELFRNPDIEPTDQKLVVVKSTNHFMAALGPIARKVTCAHAGRPLSRNDRRVPYVPLPRQIWPLNEVTMPRLRP